MSDKTDGIKNTKSAKVLKLGFNISVSGDPETDFEIVLDDKEQKAVERSSSKDDQFQCLDVVEYSKKDMPKQELEKKETQEVTYGQLTGAIPKQNFGNSTKSTHSSESSQLSESEKMEYSLPKDSSLIDQIKSTMEHFEKFSDHIKEIPRLRNSPVATSTPLANKYNSKSDPNLLYPDYRPRKFSHRYDFYSRKEYFKSSVRPLPPDLFLKPLPGEGYYKRGIYSRYLDLEPYRHFGSDNSLNKSICSKSNYDIEKYEESSFPLEQPSGILKKTDSESGDKQSTSSADSLKDIKIYQSGGILIMQNFKDGLDLAEKKEMSEFSAKLIENCNKLKMEVSGFQDDIPAIGNSSDENKNLGKTVQFDLSSFEGQKSKSGDSSSNAGRDECFTKMESSESTSDCLKNKDSSPQGTSQSQEFPSLSTQENDSIISNQPGMSPSYASSKKLEWDSGADVGYLNMDLTKENLSTIEKIVLKGLSSDGRSEKNVVYEKQPEQNPANRSKFILERMPSDLIIEGLSEGASNSKNSSNGSKQESDSRKLSSDGSEGKAMSKAESRAKFEEIKPSSNESSAKRISSTKPTEARSKRKTSETTDKSINVNTLFGSLDFQTPFSQLVQKELIKSSESLAKPKLKKSPKVRASKSKNRLLKCHSIHKSNPPTAKPSPVAMGGPKKTSKKFETTPAFHDLELSREVEEIIIDQRFKIKQNMTSEQSKRETEISSKDKVDRVDKDVKSKGRPISGSSATSNNTVLSKVENAGEKTKTACNKLSDQIIQTSDYDCDSVGIQAFSSRKSSEFDCKSFRKNSQKPPDKSKESVNVSSKNIQAFGLNSSLPKQLEHQKGTELISSRQAKSTQYFGGPLNSLPNYHSNLVTKAVESCGRVPNILKAKKNCEAEIIRLKEENQKNILANDVADLMALSEPKSDSKRLGSNDNKENLIAKKSTNSKRSNSSRRNSKGNGTASQDSEMKGEDEEKVKKRSPSVECSDCAHTSDEVSSMILTSEVLKVHGDSIDRNIIKEKYFQSQLDEMEKRKMVSRSTSMEMHLDIEGEETGKDYTTTGCQYSPQSRDTTSGGRDEKSEGDSSKKKPSRKTKKSSRQNIVEEVFGTGKSSRMGAGDSLPSSTQTAHSWVPGVPNSRENSGGVGKARSFEYLPGHIYESSGNLREKLPSETEQNLITSSSESDTAKGSSSDGGDKNSEGRNTLILENSSQNSERSNQLKILDDNLSLLSSALLRFCEKDAQVQNLTQSLFMNFWKKKGCGDWFPPVEANSSKTEVEENGGLQSSEKKRSDTHSGSGEQEPKKSKSKEFSIACQTEGKSPSPDPEKLYEDRKALEKRISEEKKSQIKWIENEIHHLNILRKLLEKQHSPVQRKKKTPHESNEVSKGSDLVKPAEIRPGQVTPVYGCTVILDDDELPERTNPRILERESQQELQGYWDPQNPYPTVNQQYGHQTNQRLGYEYPRSVTAVLEDLNNGDESENEDIAQYVPNSSQYVPLSVSQNNWRNSMLSVGVQVSMTEAASLENRIWDEMDNFDPQISESADLLNQVESYQSDINTQFPSGGRGSRNVQSTSIRTDLVVNCDRCNKDNCLCLNFSDKSYSSLAQTSKSRISPRRPSAANAPYADNENNILNPAQPEFREKSRISPRRYLPCAPNAPYVNNENNTLNSVQPEFREKSRISPRRHLSCAPIAPCMDNENNILNSTEPEFREMEDVPDFEPERVVEQNDRSDLCDTNHKSVQGTICKCQNCPKRISNALNKAGIICRGPCQSNLYLNCEKIADDCRCSKLQKPPNCACHLIKILGSKCCSAERCRRRTCTKKTENQSCQTEPVFVENYTEEPEIQEPSSKQSLSTLESDLSTQANKPAPKSCGCKRRAEKERGKADDHPRHYFLRIEETEVDDSIESMDQKKSLEVITVKVPVKKAGKSKIYGNNFRPSSDNLQNEPLPTCNCCAECVGNRKQSRDYERRANTNYRKAEKPESPTRTSSKQTQETDNFYDDFIYPSKEPSRQEFNRDRNNGFAPAETISFGGSLDESPEPECCDSCKCINRTGGPSRDLQNEYKSQKNRNAPSKEYYDGGNARYNGNGRANGRSHIEAERGVQERSSEYRTRGQELNPEYYNYNKREFMTKSEILKEEEQKRKVHQPSLQECLSSNRPDFYNNAERRRHIITKRAEDRVRKHKNRMECLMNIVQQCNDNRADSGSKRIFTTGQMREQTMKRYRKLPEVTGKKADQRKKDEYKTNRLMAEVFAKKLQIEALKGKPCVCKPENLALTSKHSSIPKFESIQ